MVIIEWSAVALSLIAMWAVGSGRRYGWLLYMAGQVVWVAVTANAALWGCVAFDVALFAIALRNWRKCGVTRGEK